MAAGRQPFPLTFQVQLYRSRMVEAGAGARLAAVSLDPTYDGQTRAAAGAIWMAVGETTEGQDSRWWGCMLLGQQAEVRKKEGGEVCCRNPVIVYATPAVHAPLHMIPRHLDGC